MKPQGSQLTPCLACKETYGGAGLSGIIVMKTLLVITADALFCVLLDNSPIVCFSGACRCGGDYKVRNENCRLVSSVALICGNTAF